MSDEAGFLRAIHQSPADDAPRLVYADWLDERGDPRGRFLRDEVAAAEQFRAGKSGAAQRLRKRIEQVGLDWALSVARPPVGVCTTLKFTKSGKPVTAPELDAAAKKAQVSLPPDYRAFLLLHNGGEPKPNQFECRGIYGPEMVAQFFPFKPREGFVTVLENYQGHMDDERHRDLFDSLLAIGAPSMDGDCLAISVAAEHFGAVFYQPYIEGLRKPTKVAGSFAGFLALIRDYRLDWVRMAEDGDAKGMRQWLAAGGNPLVKDPQNDFTPMHYAICHKRVGVVKVILDRKPRYSKAMAATFRDMVKDFPNHEIRKLIEDYLGPK